MKDKYAYQSLLTTKNGQEKIQKITLLKYKKSKSWTQAYGHSYLFIRCLDCDVYKCEIRVTCCSSSFENKLLVFLK